MLVMRFADVQLPAPLSLLRYFAAQYKFLVIFFILTVCLGSLAKSSVQTT